jgi:glycosyltransferase involved in cell wall biosynthesis
LGSTAYGVVYFSGSDWAFRKQDHHFIAIEYAARGHPVLFIENTGARFPGRRDLHRLGSRIGGRRRRGPAAERPPDVDVVSPICIPGADTRPERALNRWLLRSQLRRGLGRLGGRDLVMWISLPTWAALDFAAWLQPDLLVYHCGDSFSQIAGLRRGIVESERELIRRSDVVFTHSLALAEHCRALGAEPVHVPVAIDVGASAAARRGETEPPPELRAIAGRVIGYMGGFNQKVDTALVDAVVAAFPRDTVVVLGSVEDPRFAPRPAPNLLVMGERPYDRIASYIAHFDVCIVPYRITDYTRAVSPAKLLEYLAVGRPVVSTPLPEALPYADVIEIAEATEPFLRAITRVLDRPDGAEARLRRQGRVEENSLERVAARFVGVLDELVRERAHRVDHR